jgi:hypothetical protein
MEMALLIAVILSIVLQTTVVAIDHSKQIGGNIRAGNDQEVSPQEDYVDDDKLFLLVF